MPIYGTMKASSIIEKENRENKFVVLFSDGKDEGSHSSLSEVIKETRGSGVSVLSVGYSRVEKQFLDIMRMLAGKTGGLFVYAPQFHDVLTMYRTSRDVSTEELEEETARHAFLKVKSKPIGARVSVNGVSKGKTPLDLDLPFGKYKVMLDFPDYYDWEALVELSAEGEIPLLVRLLPVGEKK